MISTFSSFESFPSFFSFSLSSSVLSFPLGISSAPSGISSPSPMLESWITKYKFRPFMDKSCGLARYALPELPVASKQACILMGPLRYLSLSPAILTVSLLLSILFSLLSEASLAETGANRLTNKSAGSSIWL